MNECIEKMKSLGFELGEDEDCIRFDHCDGNTIEFDSWEDVANFLKGKRTK